KLPQGRPGQTAFGRRLSAEGLRLVRHRFPQWQQTGGEDRREGRREERGEGRGKSWGEARCKAGSGRRRENRERCKTGRGCRRIEIASVDPRARGDEADRR